MKFCERKEGMGNGTEERAKGQRRGRELLCVAHCCTGITPMKQPSLKKVKGMK